MTEQTVRQIITRIFLLLGCVLGAPALADQDYSDIVVFGDSLSDPGNAFVLTGQTSRPPYQLIPGAPYAIGGQHFSNGRTWAERFVYEMDLRAGAAFRNPAVYSNYAVGGARARAGGSVDLTSQVSLYLGNQGGVADPDALYVIFIGGNDLRDALAALGSDPGGMTSAGILSDTVKGVADNIATLAASGAENMLVFNGPDLSLVPAVRLQGPAVQGGARFLSGQYNLGLDAALDSLAALFPALDLVRFDLFGLFNQVVMQPGMFELQNVAQTCITPGVIVGAICKDPERYLFWDGIHPTSRGHGIIADAVEALFDNEHEDDEEYDDDEEHDDGEGHDEDD